MIIRKTFRFEASHILPNHEGKCSRLHGHSWVLHVSVEGRQSGPNDFVRDFADVSRVMKPIVEKLDHYHLNEVTGIYPCSENLLWWIADQIGGQLDVIVKGEHGFKKLQSHWCTLALEETCTSYCELSRKEYDAKASHR